MQVALYQLFSSIIRHSVQQKGAKPVTKGHLLHGFMPSIHTVSAVGTILKDAICHRQRASLRTQKGTNATIKGRLWQD